MIKPVSSACNMRCRYCFYADEASRRAVADYGRMRSDTMQQLIRRAFLYAEGSVSFAFQGGEPTLAGIDFYRDFVAEADRQNTRRLPVAYALQTNGLLLDDALCAFLSERGFLVGVSVDGAAETHDACRRDAGGAGTYDRAMAGIRALQKHGVEYNILCVVTAAAAAQPAACWQSLAAHRCLQFIPCIDGLDGEKHDFSLSPAAYGQFLIDTFACYERAWQIGAPISERRFDNYLTLLMGGQPEACGMGGVCGRYFMVEADGGVYPCDFYGLDGWRLGSVQADSFRKLEKSERYQRFHAESRVLPPSCQTCRWLGLCKGGCRRDREPFAAGVPSENRLCEGYRMFFDACFPRMQALARRVAAHRP